MAILNKKKVLIVLLVIIIFAAFLRICNLGSTKLGFFRDEAALGFNSWSILKTGADEYGQKFPIIFRSFEVFFMPAYVYISTIFFFIFGKNEFAARFLSAISGILITFLAFLIADKIFKSKVFGLLAAFVVAASPWAIFYSRGAFEGNLSLLFFLVGFYLWVLFLEKKKSLYFFLSIFGFVLSMYSYQAPRFVVPLFVGFSILIQKDWLKKWKLWFTGLVLALLLYFPIVKLTASPASYHRALGVSIFTTISTLPGYNNNLGVWQKLYLYPRELLSLYLSYFSPSNIFWNGDYNLQRNVPNFSIFYVWQLPFLIIGLWFFLKKKIHYRWNFIIWLLISPIPAALTNDPFHTYRAILFWFPLSLLVSYGVGQVCNYRLFVNKKSLFYVLYLAITIISLSAFMFSLFKTAPVLYSRQWDYGYKEISDYIKSQSNSWRIVIDDPQTTSYIHLLFYDNIDIKFYQQIASKEVDGRYYDDTNVLRPSIVGRFEFRKVDWPTERGEKHTIFIFPSNRLPPSEFSGDPKLFLDRTIFSPNGNPAFYIIKTLSF